MQPVWQLLDSEALNSGAHHSEAGMWLGEEDTGMGDEGFIYTENAFCKALLIACSFSKLKTFWKEVVAFIKNKPSIIDLKGIFRKKWRIAQNYIFNSFAN